MTINHKYVIIHIIIIFSIIGLMWVLIRANTALFDRLKRRQGGIHLVFFERVIRSVILIGGSILALSGFGGLGSIWKTFLGGTAIVSAVLAFAAQDIIKDILAGMMISIYKPFEIGNRIELEGGLTGVVKDITMRHVVLATVETQRLVIPNSRLNSMVIKNNSYHTGNRSALFSFHIAYGSDVAWAMEVIRQAVEVSPYSVQGRETADGADYGDVYFMEYKDSSLRLQTTVYYNEKVPSEVVISDINLRVNYALRKNGIEIPYQYVNIINKNSDDVEFK